MTYYQLTEEKTGYALDFMESWWSVIQPEATTNLITNPSFETGLSTGYALGTDWTTKTVVTEDGNASGGVYSLKLVPGASPLTSNVVDWAFTAVISTAYTMSLDVKMQAGETYVLEFRTGAGSFRAGNSHLATQTGWQRISLSYVEQAGGAMLARFKGNNNSATIYIDRWQLEAKAYATTYVDGDVIDITQLRRQGTSAYYWNGARNASTSSRTAHTNSGGRVISLGDYQFKSTGVIGLGMPEIEISAFDLGYGGQAYQGISVKSSEFTITGIVWGKTLKEMVERRKGILELLRPNKTRDRQQLILLHQWRDHGGNPFGPEERIVCSYLEGLQGNITNYYQEALALKFYATNPYPQELFQNTTQLAYQNTWTNIGVQGRDATGTWDSIGTGAVTGTFVYAVAYENDTVLWAGGAFTQIAAVAAHRIAYWDGAAWNEPGDGFNNTIEDIAIGQGTNGWIVAGGQFTADGLAAGTYRRLARWNGSAWAELDAGVDATVREIAAYHNGDFYIAGDFTTDGTAAVNLYRVAKFNAATGFTVALNTAGASGLNAAVYTVAIGPDGNIYFGGNFTDIQGAAANTYMRVVRYNVATDDFTALGEGFNNIVHKLAFSPDGVLHAVGDFTLDGTATFTLRRFAKWNGNSWEEVGGGLSSGQVSELAFDTDGAAYVASTTLGTLSPDNIPFTSYVARWNGSSWIPTDVILPAAQIPRDITVSPSGKMAIGCSMASLTLTGAQSTTVTNNGTADARPIISILGPGTVGQVYNRTTNTAIYFNNTLNLAAGETMYIEVAETLRIWSNFRSNLLNNIIIGPSNLADFRLAIGDNNIAILADDEDGNTNAWSTWHTTNWGIDR